MNLQDQNILFFTRTMAIGGTETVILQLCEVFKPLVNKIVVCSAGGENEKYLEQLDIKHYLIPDIEKKTLNNFFSVNKTIRKIIENEDITIIHTHHRMSAFYCQMIGKKNRPKLVNTSHTAFYDKKALTHMAFRGFNMIACGHGVKNSLTDGLGFSSDRITVICNGIKAPDTGKEKEEIIPVIAEARAADKHIFGAIGRLSKEKGVEFLARAVPLLSTHNILCVIVGSGPEEQHLHDLISEISCEEKFAFLGFRKDIFNIISQVDFVVQPSLQEGLPLVPIEAFALGKTVVGTDIDGNSEIIEHQKNGLLVPAANEKALAEAIDYMCNSDRTQMEKNALESFYSKYEFSVFAKEYVDYYKRML